MKPKLFVVTPVYDDWESFGRLMTELDRCLAGRCSSVTVVAVDDGSPTRPPAELEGPFTALTCVEVLELAVNLGHQRAIAVGLAHAGEFDMDCVVVMDSDGEDRPEHVAQLLSYYIEKTQTIHVVERGQRSESLQFRIFYVLYRALFSLCTGTRLKHGNFSLIPARQLIGLLHSSNTWNNLAASIVRSRMPYCAHEMDRGRRYAGQSKMAFTSLLIHGLSAVSVYLDILTARLLIFSGVSVVILITLVLAVITIKLFSSLAIPGWTTIAVGLLLILMTQVVLLAASILFTLLHNRGQSLAVPTRANQLHAFDVRVLYGAQLVR